MYNLNPKTRKEHLMGKIAGNPNAEEITDLKTREEHFLKDIEEASGYTVTEERVVVIPEQTVETGGAGYYTKIAIASGVTQAPTTMKITFNGTNYFCEAIQDGSTIVYSDSDSGDNYIFAVIIFPDGEQLLCSITTPAAQTVTIKAEAVTKTVTPSDDFTEAVAKASEPFIVTLTPTAASYSGAMDKTGAEISQAYAAGKKIVFNVLLDANGSHVEVPLADRVEYSGGDEIFHAYVYDLNSNVIVCCYIHSYETNHRYETKVYPLTPAT